MEPVRPLYAKRLCQTFTSDALAELLNVSKRTAQRYRIGDSVPPASAIRLIELHTSNRIIPKDWPKQVTLTPDGDLQAGQRTITPTELEHYAWIVDQYYASVRLVNDLNRKLSACFEHLTLDQKLTILPYRRKLMDILTEKDNPKRHYMHPWHLHRMDGC